MRPSGAAGLVAFAALAGLGLGLAPAASAAITCEFDAPSETLFVQVGADGDEVELNRVGTEIRVISGGLSDIDCDNGGGDPAVDTTDAIVINDNSGGGDTIVELDPPSVLEPGETNSNDATGTREIELNINWNGGSGDELQLIGTPGDDDWRLGTSGLNWNPSDATPDTDVSMPPPPPRIVIFGFEGNDVISGRGGAGTGSPVSGSRLEVAGGNGNDTIEGGDFVGGFGAGDSMSGQAGNDIVRGFVGNETINGNDAGDDILEGGVGSDALDFTGLAAGARIDLGQDTPQATGAGTDAVTGFEFAIGSAGNDTLIGNEASNLLAGQAGDDLLDGRGGGDELIGAAGIDTASYAEAPAGVTVDLSGPGLGSASGGAGADTLTGFDNIIGSEFADDLTGSGTANSITGLGGSDTVRALAGPDAVDVRDGEADVASCGTETDTAIADRQTLDTIDPDCETIDFLPEPIVDGGGAADTELSFDLSGKGKQRVLKQKGVVVIASCPLEACSVTASGKGKVPRPNRVPLAKLNLKPVTEAVGAGVAERIKLRLKRRQLRVIAAALRAGKKPKVKVSAQVTDAAGNVAADALTVKAKR